MATASLGVLVLWAVVWYMAAQLSLLLLCTVSQLSAGRLPFGFIFHTGKQYMPNGPCMIVCVCVCESVCVCDKTASVAEVLFLMKSFYL